MKKLFSLLLAGVLAVGLAACEKQDNQGNQAQTAAAADANDPNTLVCLSGSELENVKPLLGELQQQTGVTLKLVSSGTLASMETLESNAKQFDCGWFSHNKYLMLNDKVRSQIKASERIMTSPVILGVKAAKAKELGWTSDGTTWADVAKASKEGKFRFAMTSPASSNTGMSALIGVTAAMSGADSAITADSIKKVELSGFGKGQVLFADSSGWLTTAFADSLNKADGPDGMVNYESELLRLNAENKANLTLIYPKEGIITADYPLMLLNSAKKQAFDKVVAFFKQDSSQKWLVNNTYRRPVVASAQPQDNRFGDHLLVEVPFPAKMDTLEALLISYLDKQRKPGHVYFVLDTSGSMGTNGGIEQLRAALQNLTGTDNSVTGRFARFRQREKVTVIEFASNIKSQENFSMGTEPAEMTKELARIRDYAGGLQANGGTAIFDAVAQAYQLALNNASKEPDYLQSIVVMTDGQSNEGMGPQDFAQAYGKLPERVKNIRIFGVLFGSDASKDQIQGLSSMTGGAVFDGSQSIASVFKKIRGYQ